MSGHLHSSNNVVNCSFAQCNFLPCYTISTYGVRYSTEVVQHLLVIIHIDAEFCISNLFFCPFNAVIDSEQIVL